MKINKLKNVMRDSWDFDWGLSAMNFAEKTTMQIDDDNCLFISVPELEMFDL